MLKAKNIVENRFWVLENDAGERIGTIAAKKDAVSYRVDGQTEDFPTMAEMMQKKGITMSRKTKDLKPKISTNTDVYGYPTGHTPHNQIWNVQMRLPMYTKTAKSSSYHCAGYYIIKFDKTWCKSHTPKLITLQRYPYLGPFKTKEEQAISLRKTLETA
jgi:hypothetical protein